MAAREKYELDVRAHNLVRSAESLLKLISELKEMLLFQDFAYLNDQIDGKQQQQQQQLEQQTKKTQQQESTKSLINDNNSNINNNIINNDNNNNNNNNNNSNSHNNNNDDDNNNNYNSHKLNTLNMETDETIERIQFEMNSHLNEIEKYFMP